MKLLLQDSLNDYITVVNQNGFSVVVVGFIYLFFFNKDITTLYKDIFSYYVKKKTRFNVVTSDTLKNHYVLIKVNQYLAESSFIYTELIEESLKREVYNAYIKIIITAYLNTFNKLIVLKEGDSLVSIYISIFQEQSEYIESKLKELLKTYNDTDESSLNKIVIKLNTWRIEYTNITNTQVHYILQEEAYDFFSKIDRILILNAQSLEFLMKSGSESFNKLNGEMSSFLTKQNYV